MAACILGNLWLFMSLYRAIADKKRILRAREGSFITRTTTFLFYFRRNEILHCINSRIPTNASLVLKISSEILAS